MNERIREFAIQSGILDVADRKYMTDAEKFAELIIKECLGDLKDRIARRYQGDEKDKNIGYGMEIVYYDIVDKFGVEE